MTTVAQMIEWMKTLPQDAIVECGVEKTRVWETFMVYENVDIDSCQVYAFTSEEDREKYPNMAGKTIVMICGE